MICSQRGVQKMSAPKMPQKVPNFRSEVVAVWRRVSDGMELHMRRDGRCFWRHMSGEWVPAKTKEGRPVVNSTAEIEDWCKTTAAGKGFYRLNRDTADADTE
jgi:hypothetical protein